MDTNIALTPIYPNVYRRIPRGYALAVSLAKNIRRLRQAAEMNQTALGKAMGVGQPSVSAWEKGTSEPSAGSLPLLAFTVGVSLDRLLQGVDAQYDAANDLPDHGSQVQKTLTRGGLDVAAAASVLKRRLAEDGKLAEEINRIIGELGEVAQSLTAETSTPGNKASDGGSRRRAISR